MFLSLCRALFLVRPATACLLHSASHIAFKRQVRPSATRTSLSSGSCRRPASSGRLARLVVALGAIRFARTDRQRASAGPQSRAAMPPSLVPRKRTRSQLPSCSAVIASPSASSNSSRESGRRSTRAGATAPALAARRASRWSSEVSGDAAASATDARRQVISAPGHLARCQRNQARTADSERERHTQDRSPRFVAWCWCWYARCAR